MQSEKAKGGQFEIHSSADLNISIPVQKLKNDLLWSFYTWPHDKWPNIELDFNIFRHSSKTNAYRI